MESNSNPILPLLPSFLRELADLLEKDPTSITPSHLKKTEEFYVGYIIDQEELENKSNHEVSTPRDVEFTDKEILTFFFLGWFVYSFMRK